MVFYFSLWKNCLDWYLYLAVETYCARFLCNSISCYLYLFKFWMGDQLPSLYTCYTILDKVLCKIVQSFLRNHSTNSHHSPSTIWIDIFPSLRHSFLLQHDDQHYWITSSTSAATPNFHIYFIDLRSIPYDSRLYDRGSPTILST